MPVLYASGYDQGSLAPLSAAAKTQQEASNQAPARLSAKLQSLDEAASLAPMNGLLADLAKHPQGSAALDSTLASAQASTQQSQFSNAQLSHAAEPDLFRSAVKELEIASDIKNVLQGTRAEIRQIAGGLVGDQAEQAAELAELRRRVEEGHTKRYADGSAYDRPPLRGRDQSGFHTSLSAGESVDRRSHALGDWRGRAAGPVPCDPSDAAPAGGAAAESGACGRRGAAQFQPDWLERVCRDALKHAVVSTLRGSLVKAIVYPLFIAIFHTHPEQVVLAA